MSAWRGVDAALLVLGACRPADGAGSGTAGKAGMTDSSTAAARASASAAERVARYTTVRLTADLTPLSARERQMIPLLIDAAREMDTIFWQEALRQPGLAAGVALRPVRPPARGDQLRPVGPAGGQRALRTGRRAQAGGRGILSGGPDPALGPAVRRGGRSGAQEPLHRRPRSSTGRLFAVPYHVAFAAPTARAAAKLRQAAALADDPGLRTYLRTPRPGAGDRRLPGQRLCLDGHEAQPARHRDRPDRDLRGRALRLQGRARVVCADQGPGAGASGWRATPPCCPRCSAGSRCRRQFKRETPGHRLRPQRL